MAKWVKMGLLIVLREVKKNEREVFTIYVGGLVIHWSCSTEQWLEIIYVLLEFPYLKPNPNYCWIFQMSPDVKKAVYL